MTTVTTRLDATLDRLTPKRTAAIVAFGALLLRDVQVLRKTAVAFLMRTVTQPLLIVFVFAYVFPEIGQGVGGSGAGATSFSTSLMPGLIGVAVVFQGIQAVALPLVSEFGYTREIEDRVMAPLPVWAVGVGKIVSGAVQSGLAALIVVPFALWIPSTPVNVDLNWPVLLTVGPLSCLLAGALGLAIGTRAEPGQVPLVFGIIVIPMTMLGAAYYPWERLDAIEWLKWAVLVNPLIYLSEGFRMALTDIPHMNAWGIYGALVGFTAVLGRLGIVGFKRRVLA
ncbi:MAG: ABC transporter permease [Acidimicrobiia bacterium]